LDEILFEKCVLLHLFANTCIIISSFLKKTHYHTKEDEIYRWALKKKFSFFCLVVFNRSQTWSLMVIINIYIIYSIYTDFIQSSSSNGWIKINFDSNWTLSSTKMLSCKFKILLLVLKIAKGCHQDFNLIMYHNIYYTLVSIMTSGSLLVCFHPNFHQLPRQIIVGS